MYTFFKNVHVKFIFVKLEYQFIKNFVINLHLHFVFLFPCLLTTTRDAVKTPNLAPCALQTLMSARFKSTAFEERRLERIEDKQKGLGVRD
jgi:hypothetical protein